MSEIENNIQEVELEMAAAKSLIEDGEALNRLTKNADFNRIIRKGYFEGEASRIVLLKAEAAMEGPEKQQRCDDTIVGIGQLYQYLRATHMKAEQARAALGDYDESLQELHKANLEDEGGAATLNS